MLFFPFLVGFENAKVMQMHLVIGKEKENIISRAREQGREICWWSGLLKLLCFVSATYDWDSLIILTLLLLFW